MLDLLQSPIVILIITVIGFYWFPYIDTYTHIQTQTCTHRQFITILFIFANLFKTDYIKYLLNIFINDTTVSLYTNYIASWHYFFVEFMMTWSNGNIFCICEGNPAATGGFPSQRPVMRSFGVFCMCTWTNRWKKPSGNTSGLRCQDAYFDASVKYIMQCISTLCKISHSTGL